MEIKYNQTVFDGGYMATFVKCPKHGEHQHSIISTIPEHQGAWCQICWLETLGKPLETEFKRTGWSNT